jgi:YebC/PmpR family DNA-binding regulatory protein
LDGAGLPACQCRASAGRNAVIAVPKQFVPPPYTEPIELTDRGFHDMAGHSHWANISRHKGIVDAKRGKLFSKLSRYIIITARNGGGDPTMNLKLRYAIDKARSVSMPKENIERAIKRGTGELDDVNYDEIMYEGYGPGGVAVLVEVTTDNRNRSNGEIKKIFERANANIGTPGCVAYMFDRKGFFAIDATRHPDEDALMTVALDAGAEDMHREDDVFEITCDPSNFSAVLEALGSANIETTEAEVKYLPKMQKEIDLETGKKVVKFIETLDDHDDVQNVYTDAVLTPEMGED